MRSDRFTQAVLLLVLVVVAGAAASRANDLERPNIVLFIADDVSDEDFGCYGHPTIQTPHVDRLAERGVRFTNAYLTISSCSPSRTSILTGRYPHNTGGPELHMSGNPHLTSLAQFPRLLREAGYYTAQAGKAHFNGKVGESFDRMYLPGDASGSAEWVQALRDRPQDKPFLMWLSSIDAHRAWDMDLAEGPHGPEDAVVPPYQVDGKRTREDLAQYYNEVHRFDQRIGEVMAELRAQGVDQETIVLVLADNGRSFPRCKTWLFDGGIKTPLIVHWPARIPGALVSDSLVSSIDIAPTILEIVGLPKPKTVQGVSFLPIVDDPEATVRDVVFAQRNWHVFRAHERMVRHGDIVYMKNNLPEVFGFYPPAQCNRRPEEFTANTALTDVVEGLWNGTLTEEQAFAVTKPYPEELLFDVGEDPHQVTNLAGDPAHEATLTRMRGLLAQWTAETGDTTPAFDEMTPENYDRYTGESYRTRGRPAGGVYAGQTTKAWEINAPGPIRVEAN